MLTQILVTPDFDENENLEYSRFNILPFENENLEYSRFSFLTKSGLTKIWINIQNIQFDLLQIFIFQKQNEKSGVLQI